MKKALYLLLIATCLVFHTQAQIITTIAGGGAADPGDGGPATDCLLDSPAGIITDHAGNVYFCDRDHARVRKIAPDGTISTFAGTGVVGYGGDNAPAINALLNRPYCLAIDAAGNIYIGEGDNHCVRKVNTSGIITTVAGTGTGGYNGDEIPATIAQLNGANGITFDNGGNLYIADLYNNRIRMIDGSGIIHTVAGNGIDGSEGDNGPATDAALSGPGGVAVNHDGSIYFTDGNNNRIRRISPSGTITKIAGTGISGFNGDNIPATTAKLNNPIGIAIDNAGNIFFADAFNARIRSIDATGIITTIAGGGLTSVGDYSPATAAALDGPVAVHFDEANNLYIGELYRNRIRYVHNTVTVQQVSNNSSQDLAIYPNPNYGHFSLSIPYTVGPLIHVVVTDIIGNIVSESNLTNSATNKIALNAHPGIYLLTATGLHYKQSVKIVVLR